MSDRKALVRSIVDQLGRQRIADELDVTVGAVGNAVMLGAFPAYWYAILSRLCAERGINCPVSAFAMKAVGDTSEVRAAE